MALLISSNVSFVPEKRKFKLSLEEHLFISCYLDITTSCLPLIQSFSVFINTEKAWKRNWLSKEERVISLSLAMLHRVCLHFWSNLIFISTLLVDNLFPWLIRKCRLRIKWKWKWSRVWLFVTPWTVAYQASPSMGFSRQEYWSGLPFPSPGDLPNPGIEPRSPAL